MPYKSDQAMWREILRRYKELKCLWHKNNKKPYTKEECNNAWEELVELVAKNINEDADKEFVQKRINDFRAACQKEMKKVKAAKEAGKRYQPRLYYYEILRPVLNEEVKELEGGPRAEKQNRSSAVISNTIVKEEVDCDSTKETEEPAAKRPRNGPAQILARRMAEHLEQMDADQALIAEKIISDICVYGRLKQLSIDSSIGLK